jgi:ribose transport system ATP-binding protein
MVNAIRLSGIKKRFGPTVALSDASFMVKSGAVHAMLGENGAGKSTLVKILSGLVQPDEGTIEIFDKAVALSDSRAASRLGLETAFQEIPLVPDFTVAQNLLMPDEPRRFGFLRDRAAARRRVEEILTDLGLPDVDPNAEIRDLDLSIRQKVEIARAIARNPKILILDEPTAALTSSDVVWLADRIEQLKRANKTVLLVTHRMQEVREFCSELSVLRNGAHVGSHVTASISDEAVFRLIMGRSVETTFPPAAAKDPSRGNQPTLWVNALTVGHRLVDASLTLWPAEIVGVAALQGMGQLELFNALFGVERVDSGEIQIDGKTIEFASPRDAIKRRIGLVPEDRKIQGLSLKQSGRENASLPILDRFSRGGWVDIQRERVAVDEIFSRVNVHPRALYKEVRTFSGGNQQKIVLAKWLLADCRVLLVFDPTRGVDIGTKHEMYILLRRFAEAGGTVLFYSTELPELIGLSDRVIVMYRGKISTELSGDDLTEERIGEHMLGAGETNNQHVREHA